MNCAKRDHARGLISEEERDGIRETLEVAVVENHGSESVLKSKGKKSTKVISSTENASRRTSAGRLVLLGCAADGRTDQAAVLMLRELLNFSDWEIQDVANETLTSELAARVAKSPPAAVCIVALPPGHLAQARNLCRRLRTTAPDLPLIVGRWCLRSIQQTDRDLLKLAGASAVTLSIEKTLQWLESMRPVLDHQQSNRETAAVAEENELPLSAG